ncbi:MAG: M20/M25/M40 family metallo-hydrolase, partial [Candidatus Heimdallarchaeota archaeon]|nr:M20/M25/M40 family metallo-hydrolase [Candidatus Heimdallarchaeota archaeon]
MITLIQNKCINPPGNELKSIHTIEKYLTDRNVTCQVFESAPNRGNLIAEIKGTGERPSLMFGPSHVDVVPIGNESAWEVDPFAGIIKDEYVWGRGTLDMLFIVATQVQAFLRLYEEGFKPRGDLRLCIVSDEEVGGKYGTEWLIKNQPDFMKVNYAVGEAGGGTIVAPNRLILGTGEKGSAAKKISFTGTPSHGSLPYRSDNAILKAATAAQRLADYNPPIFLDYVKTLAKGFGLNKFLRILLGNRFSFPLILKLLYKQQPEGATLFHALSRMTISPNVFKGGNKVNVIAGTAEFDVDIRPLPFQDEKYVEKHLQKALGSLWEEATIQSLEAETGFFSSVGTASNPESEIIPFMHKAIEEYYPNATLIPLIIYGATDLRYLRAQGTQAYGFSLFEPETPSNVWGMCHAPNERISLKTLEYTFKAYYNLAKEFLK